MRQEAVAGIVLCVMSLAMLFISPNAWWTVAEKWKTEGKNGPARSYRILLHVLGVVFAGAGIVLALHGL